MITNEQILALSTINDGCWIGPDHLIVGPNMRTKLLHPETEAQPVIVPRLTIQHTNAGANSATPEQLWTYASATNVVIEPHLDFGTDGSVLQFVPFNRRADCNYKANLFAYGSTPNYGAIAHESQDEGTIAGIGPWSGEQILSLIRANTAECVTYRIRCTIPTHWRDSGVGYHCQYPEWSSTGHSCPTPPRIRQMPWIWNEVATRVAAYYGLVGGTCP